MKKRENKERRYFCTQYLDGSCVYQQSCWWKDKKDVPKTCGDEMMGTWKVKIKEMTAKKLHSFADEVNKKNLDFLKNFKGGNVK